MRLLLILQGFTAERLSLGDDFQFVLSGLFDFYNVRNKTLKALGHGLNEFCIMGWS